MNFKKYGIHIVILAMLATFALPLGLDNGSKVFISDIVIVCVSLVYFGMIFSRKIDINKKQNIFLQFILVFICYLFITAGIHTYQFGFSKEYIMLIRNFYAAAFMLFFLSSDKITKDILEDVLLIFVTLSNIYQLIYLVLKFEIRSSPLFINVVLYAIAMQVALAFLFKISSTKSVGKLRLKKIFADFNILAIVCLIPMSGLRAGTVSLFVLLLFYMIYFTILNGKRMFIKCIVGISAVSLLAGGVLAGAYLTGNVKLLTVFSRTFGIKGNSNSNSNSNTLQNTSVPSTINQNVNTASQSDEFRNAINNQAIEVIKENVLIGKGELQIDIYDHSKKQILNRLPHNVFLELLIGYGVIGTAIFMMFLLLPFYNYTVRFRKKRNYILSLSIVIGFFVFSQVQPTINRMLPLQVLFMVQAYLMKCDDLAIKNRRKRRSRMNMQIQQSRVGNSNFELRDLQLIMLENMKIIHQICVKHNIQYSLCGGSVVGAIVHKGFVPWDDDIDVMMDRFNYDRFCRILPNELPENLELINYKNSGDTRVLISKIVDKNYIVTYETTNHEKIDMGLYIDVTVMDKIPVDVKKRRKLVRRSRLGLLLIGRNAPKNKGMIAWFIGLLLVKLSTEKFKVNFGAKTEKLMKKGVHNGEEFIYGELLIYWGKIHEYNPNLFSEYELMTFEDTEFYVVSNYHQYLWARYNRDYRILPPKEEQAPHHGILAVKKIG